ncbi:MAG: ribosome silencing factor [Robiginitomaculum sp.]
MTEAKKKADKTKPKTAHAKTSLANKKTLKAEAKKLSDFVLNILEKQSAEEITNLDLDGKSSIADYMIIASGRSNPHVSALTDYVIRGLKELGHKDLGVEGLAQSDWVLIDAGDVIVHLFRPEVRNFYSLEKLWSVPSLNQET